MDFWCGWWRANISDAGFSFDTATNRGGWGMEWDLQVLDMRVRTLVRFVRRVVRRVGFMGMGEDFEGAIVQGSSEVRVGSTIFGERPPKSEAKVLEDVEEGKK